MINDSTVAKAYKIAFASYKFENVKIHEHLYAFSLNKDTGKKNVSVFNKNDIISNMKERIKYTDTNHYISANPLKGEIISTISFNDKIETGLNPEIMYCTKRTNDKKNNYFVSNCAAKRFGIQNLVIDMDWHDIPASLLKIHKDTFMAQFNIIFSGLPTPNIVHFTGRGFQIWWCFKEVSLKLEWLYNKIKEKFIEILKLNLSKAFCFLAPPDIDRAASFNSAGLFRAFGSVNPHPEALDTELYIYKDSVYTIDELREGCGFPCFKSGKKFVKYYQKEKLSGNLISLMNKRIEIITYKALQNKGNKSEFRHITLYYLLSCLIPIMNADNVRSEIIKYNQILFNNPLPTNDLNSLLKGSKKHYKFKNSTIIETFHITEDEQNFFNFFSTSNKCNKNYYAPKKKRNNIRKEKLINNIILHFKASGSVTKAAKDCGVSYNTANKYITASGIKKRILTANKLLMERKEYNNHKQKHTKSSKISSKYDIIRKFAKRILKLNGHSYDEFRDIHIKDNFWLFSKEATISCLNLLDTYNTGYSRRELHAALFPFVRYTFFEK